MESEKGTGEQAEGPSVIQERLNWKPAWRDDAKVAQGLYAGEAIEEMHELSDAGLLDEFFVFLEEVGILRAFEQINALYFRCGHEHPRLTCTSVFRLPTVRQSLMRNAIYRYWNKYT